MRTIQNNVRGWILRKNYTNLREAAKVLQVAWREKRRVSIPGHGHHRIGSGGGGGGVGVGLAGGDGGNTSSENALKGGSGSGGGGGDVAKSTIGMSSSSGVRGGSIGGAGPLPTIPEHPRSSAAAATAHAQSLLLPPLLQDPNPAQLLAAATLQAATRGMIARRSFSSVRRQTMASLVIQKSLVKWWEHNKVGGGGIGGGSSGGGNVGGDINSTISAVRPGLSAMNNPHNPSSPDIGGSRPY